MKCPLLATQLSALSVILAVLVFSPGVVFADSIEQHGAVLETGVSNTFSAGEIEGIMTHFEMCGLGDEDLGQIYVDLTENNLLFYQIIINMTSANYSQEQATISCGQEIERKYMASSSMDGFIFGVEEDVQAQDSQLREETEAEAAAKAEAEAAAKAEAEAAAKAEERKVTETKCYLDEDGLTKKQFKKEAKNYIECLKDELKQEKKSLKESLSKKEFKEQFEILKDQFKQIKKQVEQKVKEM